MLTYLQSWTWQINFLCMSIKNQHGTTDQIKFLWIIWSGFLSKLGGSLPCVRVLRIRLLQPIFWIRNDGTWFCRYGFICQKQWSFYKTGKMWLPFLSQKQVYWENRGVEVSIKSEVGMEIMVRNIRSCRFLQKKALCFCRDKSSAG